MNDVDYPNCALPRTTLLVAGLFAVSPRKRIDLAHLLLIGQPTVRTMGVLSRSKQTTYSNHLTNSTDML